ncbi:MAG: transcriptional regulator, partial [Phenylobacterium sp.]|nr:transcriptional regulator [Phenylobacterium sp.]
MHTCFVNQSALADPGPSTVHQHAPFGPNLGAGAGAVHRFGTLIPFIAPQHGETARRPPPADINSAAPYAIAFGRFRLLTRSRELLADGAPVPLGSRAVEVLLVLIEAGGELVTKDELLSRVWPTTTVEENCLQFQISTLRKALGPDRDIIR